MLSTTGLRTSHLISRFSHIYAVKYIRHIRVSPYLETRIGYSVGDIEGFFCAPAAGCHIYFGKSKMGLSFGIGYNLQLAKVSYSYGSGYPVNENFGGVSISAAFDF